MNLSTERLQICPIVEADRQLYCQIYCDPVAMHFVAPAFDREKANRCFAYALQQSQKSEQNLCLMSIAWRVCGSKIGICGFQRLAQDGLVFEPGCMLLPSSLAQGVGTEVVAALCQALFCQTAAAEIWLQYRADNVAADRLVHRLGYCVEYSAPLVISNTLTHRVILRR